MSPPRTGGLIPSAALAALILLPSGWTPLLIKRIPPTSYAWDGAVLHAVSSASASGLIHRLDDNAGRPLLSWRWKVAAPLPPHDERTKRGDDFAARVYVTFRYEPSRAGAATRLKYRLVKALYGEFPPHAGISYVWAAREPVGTSWPNPYTERVRMVALRSGPAEAGVWLSERRDVGADYRSAFGEDPPPLSGVVVMTDTDGGRGTAEAWYSDFTLAPPR